jgi:hypothetical protein
VEKPLPLQVGGLGNLEARMVRNFRAAIDDWDEVCTALGAWEGEHLASENDGAAKEQHRRWITELLSWGQLVQRAVEQPQFPDKELAARVRSRIRHLEDKLSLWHREMSTAEEERILKAAF